MLPGATELRSLHRIRPLLSIYPWATPLLIVLGILNSLVEWLGIALLIPLLQGAQLPQPGAAPLGRLYALIFRLTGTLPAGRRTLLVAAVILGALLLKVALAYAYTLLCQWLEGSIVHELRSRVFRQLMRLGPRHLDETPAAQTIDLLISETDRCGRAFSYFVWVIINLCMIGVFSLMLLQLSLPLTCMVGLSMLLISRLVRVLTRRVEPLAAAQRSASVELHGRIVEDVTGLATISAFGREADEAQRSIAASRQAAQLHHAFWRLVALVNPISEGLSVTVLLALLLFAVLGGMPLPALLAFVFMLYRLQPQIRQFEQNRVALLGYSTSIDEVMRFLDPADKVYPRAGEREFPGLVSEITLAGVAFQYPAGSAPAVEDIYLRIPKGQMTALVGPSGSGKTTLTSLLCRFYDPTAGSIEVDGTPLHTFTLPSWRQRLAVVSQDSFLFAATVRENLSYGRPDATDAEIIDAARRAHAHDFIVKLPQGYDTLIGDRGIRLSGGQRQRLAIARAFLRGAELLILDEATNELDGLSESLIHEVLSDLRGRCTVLAIAHRLSTVAEADQIVVLHEGRIAEQGAPGELIRQNGLFARLYDSQRQGVKALDAPG